MFSLILRTLKVNRKQIIVYFIITAIFVLMYSSIFPSIQKDAAKMADLFESYPEALTKAFNIDENMFTRYENYLGAEHYSLLWPIIAIILALSLAGGSIAGEIEKRTIQFLLSQPLSRTKVFIAKYVSGIALLTIFTFSSIIFTLPIALALGVEIDFEAHLALLVSATLFCYAIFSIGFLFSSIFSTKGIVASMTGGIILIMYALSLLASLKESLDGLKYTSLFYYYDYSNILRGEALEVVNLVVFILVCFVCSIAALAIFRRRDLVN